MISNQLRYIFGTISSLPILPLLYFQGIKIRKKIPKLPEAKHPQGFVNNNFKNSIHIITIGESTIAGVGVEKHKTGFTGALANQVSILFKKNVYWNVFAKSGYTAKEVTKKILPNIQLEHVDLIVIGLGGNDAFSLNSPRQWRKDILQLISILKYKYPKTPIYFTNMPPIKEFPAFTKSIKCIIGNLVEILGNELFKIVKKEFNVYYYNESITLENWSKKHQLKNQINLFFSDGVHPSELTYKIWGQEMATFIYKNEKPSI